jgi:cellulose synthase/poly-beta-1,6-N-acetylglucosamine synthase-like glycosyltransferase
MSTGRVPSAWSALTIAITAFLAVKTVLEASNALVFPVLGTAPGATGADLSDVSVLIPVRNEALRLPGTLPAVLAEGAGEVILIDDGSDDDTVAVARRLISAHDILGSARVVEGSTRPAGWAGKTWAAQQLGALASGDILVYLDADTVLAPGALSAAREEMRRQGADVFSVIPRQITGSLGEHLVLPCIDDVVLSWLPFDLLKLPIPSAATAWGGFLMFTASGLRELDGFAGVRSERVEDVALARLARRRGIRLGLAFGGDLVAVRMYEGFEALVAGLGRGLVPAARGSRPAVLAAWALSFAAYTLPWIAATRDRRWLLPAFLGVLQRVLVEANSRRRRWWQAVLVPAIPIASGVVVAQAMRRTHRWRGRTYSS